MAQHEDLLNRTVAYPSTNYPGRTEEALLNTLLRKKVEPPVESWMEEGRVLGQEAEDNGVSEAQEDLWNFALESIGGMMRDVALKIMANDYTKEERAAGIENVRTGLKVPPEDSEAKSEDGEEDDDDEEEGDDSEDEEMEDADGKGKKVKQPVVGARSLDDMVVFMTTGRMPGERG